MSELKLEAGKFYKTRDGQTAKIDSIHPFGDVPFHGAIYDIDNNEWYVWGWTAKGNNVIGPSNDFDIVAEWTLEDEAK